jgi:hypothetical protein
MKKIHKYFEKISRSQVGFQFEATSKIADEVLESSSRPLLCGRPHHLINNPRFVWLYFHINPRI